MSFVKGADEPHVSALAGAVLAAVRASFVTGDWNGLRQSHFRLLSHVPPEGIRITELAERLGMTKQGCGQFVSPLGDAGYLDIAADPLDRRARVVRRTPKADDLLCRVDARIERVEQDWARRVGVERYATFRQVMIELVGDAIPLDYRRPVNPDRAAGVDPGVSSGNPPPGGPG